MRFLRTLFLFVPLMLLMGTVAWLYGSTEKRAEAWAAAKYAADVKQAAAELLTGEGEAMRRPKGLRMTGTVDGHKYGCNPIDGTSCVWVEVVPGHIRFEPCNIAMVPVRRLAMAGGVALAVLMLAMWWFSIRSFRRDTELRDEFLAAASHDLMTPLVCLRFGYDKAQVERLIRLVGNINDFLKLGGRRPPPVPANFPVARAIKEAYAIFKDQYEEEESGPVEITGDDTLEVFADETLTVQILWNLFGNELKYAAPFGKVKVSFGAENGKVSVVFVDEGPGMTWWQRHNCFNRYYRARTAMESGRGGFGIGLCTAKELAEAMGGGLKVRANNPHGCIFVLDLPSKI